MANEWLILDCQNIRLCPRVHDFILQHKIMCYNNMSNLKYNFVIIIFLVGLEYNLLKFSVDLHEVKQ